MCIIQLFAPFKQIFQQYLKKSCITQKHVTDYSWFKHIGIVRVFKTVVVELNRMYILTEGWLTVWKRLHLAGDELKMSVLWECALIVLKY